MNHREVAYSLLRITFGIVFLFNGFGKVMGGVGNFVGGMNQRFAGKLPALLVMPFSYTLPFAELLFGALIVLGLFTRLGLVGTGLLLAALTFGTVVLADFPTVAHNTQYALVNFVLLWLVDVNRYSLDSLFRRKTLDHRAEATDADEIALGSL
jgi:thiosulfate dehydrogenase [quinone] large subunit